VLHVRAFARPVLNLQVAMHIMWAPWRVKYILGGAGDGCIFCDKLKENKDPENHILFRGKKSFCLLNAYPYNSGHVMVAPYSHVGELELLDDEELLDLMKVTRMAMKALNAALKPDGFNIGITVGRGAGAGITDHVHVHIVPRWGGDTNFMPVTAGTKVIPQSLDGMYETLAGKFSSEGY